MKKNLSILVVLMFILISTFTFAGYQVDFGYVAGDLNFSNGTIRNFNTLQFNTSGGNDTTTEGTMHWNPEDHTVNIVTGLGAIIQIGTEQIATAKNNEGSTIYNGQIVSFLGSTGERGQVILADASNSTKSSRLAVVTTESCTQNAECQVTTFGRVRNLDTSMWTSGDLLYLSADGSGNLTSTQPNVPNYHVSIGFVIRSHPTEGIIFVNPQLDYTDGVVVNSLNVLNDLLVYNNTNILGDLGVGLDNPAAKFHIYQSGNESLDGLLIQEPNTGQNIRIWHEGNTRGKIGVDATEIISMEAISGNVGIGIDDPDQKLDVDGNIAAGDGSGQKIMFGSYSAIEQNPPNLVINRDYDYTDVKINGNTTITGLVDIVGTQNVFRIETETSGTNCGITFKETGVSDWDIATVSGDLLFYDSIAASTRMSIDSNGNVGVGIDNPSYPLHVYQADSSGYAIRIGNSNEDAEYLSMGHIGANAAVTFNGNDNYSIMYMYDSDGDNVITLNGGDGSILVPEIYSDTVGATNRDLYIDNTGKLGYLSSSERYKTNIQDLNNTNWIYDLRPVSFDYIDESKGINKMGLIAEEVEEVNPNIVSYNILDNGSKQVETVTYSDLVVPLLKELQEANERITYLEEVLSDKYPEIVPQYQTSDDIEYTEQPDFNKPIECRADNLKYCFTEEACLFNNGYWDGSKCSEIKDDKYCSSEELQYCFTEEACLDNTGVWQDSECVAAEI